MNTDRHGSYNKQEGQKQSCLAHIDRHFDKMSERPGVDASFGIGIALEVMKFIAALVKL